jgi:hypothetical protein
VFLADYALFIISAIYIFAFLVSLYRPILRQRYLSIFLPFIFSILPALVFNKINLGKFRQIVCLFLLLFMFNFADVFRSLGGNSWDVYKEGQEYITADSGSHHIRSFQLGNDANYENYNQFYGLPAMPNFQKDAEHGVIYINPFLSWEDDMYELLARHGFDATNVLKIKTNKGKYIFKKIF